MIGNEMWLLTGKLKCLHIKISTKNLAADVGRAIQNVWRSDSNAKTGFGLHPRSPHAFGRWTEMEPLKPGSKSTASQCSVTETDWGDPSPSPKMGFWDWRPKHPQDMPLWKTKLNLDLPLRRLPLAIAKIWRDALGRCAHSTTTYSLQCNFT